MDGIVVLETCTAYSRASETAEFERNWNTRILLMFPRNVRFTSLFFTPKLVLESDPGIKIPDVRGLIIDADRCISAKFDVSKGRSSSRLINSRWLHP
jgi:hypothetical protein